MKKNKKETLVLIGAKIPADLKALIEKKSINEERSLSQVISRLLASHPHLKQYRKVENLTAEPALSK